jgi:uncharacterized YccA/Bax inhibitor family protein
MRTTNPVMRADVFEGYGYGARGAVMTVGGTVAKTAIFLTLTLFTTLGTFALATRGVNVAPVMWGGMAVGFVFALITAFKRTWAPVTGAIYALAEGLFLGAISAIYNARYPGIAIAAAGCTVGTLAALLLVYQSGLIKVTQKFRMGVFAATGGIALFYLIALGMSFFGVSVPLIHQGGWLGIGFSLFVVTIAALNLVLDFDFIERGAEAGAPKYMEWYAAFGLMVTLVWLYIEILRLLAKVMGRRS